MLNMVALQWSQPYVKLFCSVSQNSCTKCQRSYNGTGKRDVSAVDKSDGQKKVFALHDTENAQSILKKVTLVLYIAKNLVGV